MLPVYQKLIGKAMRDGFVLIDPLENDPRIDFLRKARLAFVVHGRTAETPDYRYFYNANQQLVPDLTAHFAARGHRRILPALTVTKAPLRDSWEPLADCLVGAIDGTPCQAFSVSAATASSSATRSLQSGVRTRSRFIART
ncbi:MAG: hypothetical protein C0524_09480 [Rhodobacter sp.]|nr:hypothetical protein [Rhodobacter sp.]